MYQLEEEFFDENQDIAIISMSGRFPGSNSIEEFWQNIRDGIESIRFFSEEELLAAGVKPERLNNPNYVKASGTPSNIDMFDASFFGCSPKDAIEIDPQQRLFLECAWEVIERGGYNPNVYEGSIGVYAGCSINSYLINNLDSESDLGLRVYLKGGDKDYLATRVAYHLNLTGPAVSIQTACSTSLVAVHIACQSLLNGECDMALAGGVSIFVSQEPGYLYQDGLVASPDGHCRAFDAKANGTVPSNGIGVVLLKGLKDAITDGDYIYAVIKGSAINNDGSLKVGYTAPSVEGQAAVIAEAHAVAGVDPETITYVETHGTGTQLGDPIEIAGLTKAFQQSTHKQGYCAIGSVKTNIGHLVTAAGVAGLIKAVLALQHKLLPPSLNFEKPNPKIDFANSPFYVNTTLTEWKTNGTPRRAGVSSFGVGGTNAHLVLQEAPKQVKSKNLYERSLEILTLSAKTETALQELVKNYHKYLTSNSQTELADICYTANTGRAHFNQRVAFIAANKQELAEKLHQYQSKEQLPGITSGQISSSSSPRKIAFLFTGQGSQYVNMGRQLYQTQAVFRAAIDQCQQILDSQLEHPLVEILYPCTTQAQDLSRLNQTSYTQPAVFAIEYALGQLWQSWGIKPDIVVGHSVGEYVAATIAGIMSLEDGLKLIAARGCLMQQLSVEGEMVAVMASAQQVQSLLSEHKNTVSLAAINAPESVVISGEKTALAAICQQLSSQNIKTKRLQVSHAFHSPLMTPMLAEFEVIANQITYHQPQIPLISNLTGEIADERITTAQYWLDHVCQPVMFAQSMQTLSAQGYQVFLEVGAQPHLLSLGRQCLPQQVGVWLASMRAGVCEWQQMLSSLAQLYVQGVAVDWSGFERDFQRQKLVLPTYPFQRQRYWIEVAHERYQDKSITSENDSSLIVNLIKQGDIKTLTQQLEIEENLSESEVALLPKLLKLIVQQHQQQLTKISIEENTLLQQKSVTKLDLLQELQAVPTVKYKQILIEYLEKQIRHILQIHASHSLNTQKSILELGFDSLSIIELKSQLEAQLEVTIPASEIIQGPSIIELAEQLTEQLTQDIYISNRALAKGEITELANQTASWIAYHKPKPNSYLHLFCFHPWGSSASIFKKWSDELPPYIEVLPIQLPGRQQRLKEKPFTEFVNLIEVLGDFIHTYLNKPFAFYGHSMGALIAFELAYTVKQKYNISPQYLFLGGAQAPSDVSFLNKIKTFSQNQILNYLLDISEIPEAIYNDKLLVEELMEIFKADLQLLQSYCHRKQEPLDCPIYTFGGIDDVSVSEEQLSLWSHYTQNTFKLQMLPGKHMFLKNNLKSILDVISEEILKLNSHE
ncbi:MAG: acyltransferase domain-containing protein [Komarekiella atlantica HA4396-MV6]|jgi:acyl transferase domain-containing protein/surfactin synthase thioesterase subunit|nr:acyltransferase domain-containing protein [Komarekiella atlantica HA4396-MV6]